MKTNFGIRLYYIYIVNNDYESKINEIITDDYRYFYTLRLGILL